IKEIICFVARPYYLYNLKRRALLQAPTVMPNAYTKFNMQTKTIALGIFCFINVQTFGQSIDSIEMHPIDIKREKCHSIDSNQTTAGMIGCEYIANEEWDIEMNKYYKLLMDTLKADEKLKLKAAQKVWLNYRDRENEFSSSMYYNMQGTMWHVVSAGRSCEIVKQRAIELKVYFDMLTFDE
ncbi:MAG: lysozyme inhibitor LprI family protein, partial [Bacteroidia bacterium]